MNPYWGKSSGESGATSFERKEERVIMNLPYNNKLKLRVREVCKNDMSQEVALWNVFLYRKKAETVVCSFLLSHKGGGPAFSGGFSLMAFSRRWFKVDTPLK